MTTLALNRKIHRIDFSNWLVEALRLIDLWLQKQHQRRVLERLDEYQRRDLGLTVEQVREEVNKPFWR